MFCPDCGKELPQALVRFCPFCGSRIPTLPPQDESDTETPELSEESAPTPTELQPEPVQPEPCEPSQSKLCTAALLLGTGTFLFGMLTLICRILKTDLRVLAAVANLTFFLAPLACAFGLAGIIVRIRNPKKRGLFRAIFGLVLGLAFGVLAAYCLLKRILFY